MKMRVTVMIHHGVLIAFSTVREPMENQDCLASQVNLDWLVFLDPWDLLDHLAPLGLQDPATEMLDL